MRFFLPFVFLMLLSGRISADVIKSVEYLIDSDRNLPLDSVLYGKRKSDFIKIEKENLNFGFLDAGLWLKIKLNSDTFISDPLLEIRNPNMDLIRISMVRGREIYHFDPIGDQFIFSKRNINHRFYHFPITLKMNTISSIYIYIDNLGDQLFIPLKITSENEVKKKDYFLQFFNGLYFGILTFVLLLNLFMYYYLREKSNFYYVFYILGLLFLQLSLEGYAFEFLWPHHIYMANHANPIFATFSVLFLLLFCREFLNLKTNLPKTDLVFRYLAIFLFLVLLMALPNINWAYKFSILSINTVAFILNLIIIPVAVYLWTKGYKAARFFVTAFIVLVICVFIFILRNFGLIPNSFLAEKSLQIGSAFEVMLLSAAIVDKFRFIKDQALHRLLEINELKSKANVELERKVNERTRELKEQKEIVEHKNKEITESIEYARRIQQGLLPSDNLFAEIFSRAFVLYLPKDIVSGDFYWTEQIENWKYIAAIDCTGHGVPGAMVSVMGFNHLNRCLNEHGLRKPAEILDKLNELMAESFRKSELTIYDGMDISLCRLDEKKGILEFAGANNPIYIVSSGKLREIKATKQAIGYSEKTEPFQNHHIEIKDGDWIYLFSDGFADQFGGPKNKKFRYKDFQILLESHSTKNPADQKQEITSAFSNWKGINDQLDDVCIIGIRI